MPPNPPNPTRSTSTLYLGDFVKVNGVYFDFSSAVTTVDHAPTTDNEITNKLYVDTTVNTLVNVQKARIDDILSGATSELNQLQAYVTSLQNQVEQLYEVLFHIHRNETIDTNPTYGDGMSGYYGN